MQDRNLVYGFDSASDLMKKVKRDKNNLNIAISSQTTSNQNDLEISDAIFNFVITAHHLKDWLQKESSVKEEAAGMNVNLYINTYIDKHPVLRICEELCNSSKHGVNPQRIYITEYVIEAPLTVNIEMTVSSSKRVNSRAIQIKASGQQYEILYFASKVIEAWTDFFEQHGITV